MVTLKAPHFLAVFRSSRSKRVSVQAQGRIRAVANHPPRVDTEMGLALTAAVAAAAAIVTETLAAVAATGIAAAAATGMAGGLKATLRPHGVGGMAGRR